MHNENKQNTTNVLNYVCSMFVRFDACSHVAFQMSEFGRRERGSAFRTLTKHWPYPQLMSQDFKQGTNRANLGQQTYLGVCLSIFVCDLYNQNYGKTQKFRSLILLHFGRVTFRFAYGGDRKLLIAVISMLSEILDVSMTPQTSSFYLWSPQEASNNSSRAQTIFGKYYACKSQDLGNRTC